MESVKVFSASTPWIYRRLKIHDHFARIEFHFCSFAPTVRTIFLTLFTFCCPEVRVRTFLSGIWRYLRVKLQVSTGNIFSEDHIDPSVSQQCFRFRFYKSHIGKYFNDIFSCQSISIEHNTLKYKLFSWSGDAQSSKLGLVLGVVLGLVPGVVLVLVVWW